MIDDILFDRSPKTTFAYRGTEVMASISSGRCLSVSNAHHVGTESVFLLLDNSYSSWKIYIRLWRDI